ncbi:MAG: hypothetical protein RJA36_1674 [Pseudomonadota bacterium]|jgi:hypothetical protein
MSTTTLSPATYAIQTERAAPKAENTRGLAAMLLAAAVAALAVVADQLIDTWADNHLFLAWLLMWTVVFAGSLLLTGTARRLSLRAIVRLDHWARARAQARADARFLVFAQQDPRLMTELQAAQVNAGQAPAASAGATTDLAASRLAFARRVCEKHLFYI